MSADIRPARITDLDALSSIENAVFETDRLSRRSFRRLLKSGTVSLIVATRQDAPAGYALVLYRKGGRTARLYSLAVAPAYRSFGYGRLLLDAAEKAASARGYRALRLEVREDNARAIGLYEGAGYRRRDRVPDYYQDGAAALRFEKSLGEQSDT